MKLKDVLNTAPDFTFQQATVQFCLRCLCFYGLLSCSVSSIAQSDTIPMIDTTLVQIDSLLTSDSLAVQSLSKKENRRKKKAERKKPGLIDRIKDKTYPNPTRAAFLSLALPGAGQFYNKKYWKIPIVYGGIGVALYFAIEEQKQYKFYRDLYKAKVDGDPNTVDLFPNATDSAVRRIRNNHDKLRQQTAAFTGIVWILGAVDAFVDAHLINFDVSEDLSMSIAPTSVYDFSLAAPSLGLQMSLYLHSDKMEQKKSFFGE